MTPGEVEAPRADPEVIGLADRARAALHPMQVAMVAGVTALPFTSFLRANVTNVFDERALALYAVAAVLLSLLGYLAVALVLRGQVIWRLSVGWSAFVFAFSHIPEWLGAYDLTMRSASGGLGVLALWSLLAVILVAAVLPLARFELFRQWLTISAWVICVANVGLFFILDVDQPTGGMLADAALGPEAPPSVADAPNVYLFLLDGYGRDDMLADVVGIDNSWFGEELEERGFQVTDRSLASYPNTIASTMALLQGTTPIVTVEDAEQARGTVGEFVRGHNATVERFEQLGYRFVHFDTGALEFTRCDSAVADVCLEPERDRYVPDELQRALIELTPLAAVPALQQGWHGPWDVYDEARDAIGPEPTFAFMHLLTPHEPFGFDEQCRRRDPPQPWMGLEAEKALAAYGNEVTCLNAEMLDTVDRIVDDDPSAVIILMSDHGPEFTTPWGTPLEEWTDDQVRDRFGTQLAVLLPESCRDEVTSDLPIMHVFPVVFACIEGRQAELAPFHVVLWRSGYHPVPTVLPPERLERIQSASP